MEWATNAPRHEPPSLVACERAVAARRSAARMAPWTFTLSASGRRRVRDPAPAERDWSGDAAVAHPRALRNHRSPVAAFVVRGHGCRYRERSCRGIFLRDAPGGAAAGRP